MHMQNLLTRRKRVVGGQRIGIGRLVARGLQIATVLMLILASQGLVTQAQSPQGYTVIIDSPTRTNYCPNQTDTYSVHVAGNGSIGPNDPLENSYIGVGTDVTVNAVIADSGIGKIVSINPMTRNSPAPDLALTDTLEFKFQATKPGTTEITFTATVDGVQATSFPVGIKVNPCRYIVNLSSKWVIPYPYGAYTLKGFNTLPIKVGPDPKANSPTTVSGTGSMTWYPHVTGTPCTFPDKVGKSTVGIQGTVRDDGYLDLTITYAAAPAADTSNCAIFSRGFSHTIEFEVLETAASPDHTTLPLPHNITAPGQAAGTTTVNVITDTSAN